MTADVVSLVERLKARAERSDEQDRRAMHLLAVAMFESIWVYFGAEPTSFSKEKYTENEIELARSICGCAMSIIEDRAEDPAPPAA